MNEHDFDQDRYERRGRVLDTPELNALVVAVAEQWAAGDPAVAEALATLTEVAAKRTAYRQRPPRRTR